ncbi:ATP-binding protein [Halalkalicoccus ordinarius]|uniref:ATP-binding protein n=1 Tax=Halalkalicoccus ordinarius TaxID=3116651 RepID=UPI00300F0AF7
MNGRLTVLYVGDPSTDGAVEETLTGEVTVVRVDPGDLPTRTTDEPVACAVVGPVEDPAGVVRTVRNRFDSPPIVALVDDERSAREALAADVAAVASSDEPPELLRARIEHAVDHTPHDERDRDPRSHSGVDRPEANATGQADGSTRDVSSANGRRDRRLVVEMLDALDDLVYAFDGEGFVQWNDRLEEVTGRAGGELSRLRPPELFEGEEADRIAEAIEGCTTDELPLTLEATLGTDGGAVPYEFTNSLLRDDGEVVGVVGVGRNVADRRRTERTLERLLEATRELMAAEDEPAVAESAVAAASRVLDLDQTGIHLVDETGERLEPIAVTDATEASLGTVPDLRKGESLAWESFETGSDRVYDDVSRESGIQNPETDLRSEMIFSLGEHGVMIVSSDDADEFDETDVYFAKLLAATITSALGRANREAALEYKNAQLEEFVGVVSHDLRNPLGVAKGYVDLARETGEDSHLERVQQSHERMEQIIDELLVLAREGSSVGATRSIDLETVARRAWENVATPEATLEIDGDGTVTANENRLVQLLENAFGNAVEHAGPDVTVRVEDCEEGFAIADDGPGIAPAKRESVFEPGYTDADGGTGFGMSIIESVAEGHGWRCSLEESETGGLRLVVLTGEEQGPNGR